MKRFIGVFLSYVCLLKTTCADRYFCLENDEELKYCDNPCEPTCQKPYRAPCPTFSVQPRCVCRAGTIRDETSGKCVNPQYCQAGNFLCPRTEVPNDCKDTCEPTCQTQGQFECIFQNKRCVCKPGLLRDLKSGKCVASNSCPKGCGENQEWRECSNVNCRETCQRPKPEICTTICEPGCSCKDGYIWDERYKKCVYKEQCSKGCPLRASIATNTQYHNCPICNQNYRY